ASPDADVELVQVAVHRNPGGAAVDAEHFAAARGGGGRIGVVQRVAGDRGGGGPVLAVRLDRDVHHAADVEHVAIGAALHESRVARRGNVLERHGLEVAGHDREVVGRLVF